MQIIKQAQTEFERILSIIKEAGYSVSDQSQKQYNFEAAVTNLKDKIKVQVFFGKKGVKTILQGNKDSELYKKINDVIFGESLFENKNEEVNEPENYIGTDESGKGDFFGPLTVAAFFADDKLKYELISLGVKDSKLLTDTQINFIAGKIKKIKNVFYEVVLISPAKYNELYTKFGNLNLLLNWAHSKAIEVLLEKVETQTVITDKFSKRELNISTNSAYRQAGNNHKSAVADKINFIQTPKGERFIGVAAASILARNAMNLWFEKQKQTGLILPKGASGEVDNAAKLIKAKFGEPKLKELAKLHFKTFQKIK